MPPRKIKCSFSDCKAAAQRISGDCAFCQGHYCNNHRLLEDHRCRNLDDVSCDSPSTGTPPAPSVPTHQEAVARPAEPQWWLVGLADVLSEDEALADLCFRPPANSARRRRLSRMLCSSTRSGRKSSRACNHTATNATTTSVTFPQSPPAPSSLIGRRRPRRGHPHDKLRTSYPLRQDIHNDNDDATTMTPMRNRCKLGGKPPGRCASDTGADGTGPLSERRCRPWKMDVTVLDPPLLQSTHRRHHRQLGYRYRYHH